MINYITQRNSIIINFIKIQICEIYSHPIKIVLKIYSSIIKYIFNYNIFNMKITKYNDNVRILHI